MKREPRPALKVIMHNEVSLDGAISGFPPNLDLYYQIAETFRADVHLVGSRTARTGIRTYWGRAPAEEPGDFDRPNLKAWDKRPWWVIPDTRGSLKGLLHVYRKSGYCRDVILLVTKRTPKDYLEYLRRRHYDHLFCGRDHADYRRAFALLLRRYAAETAMTDSGGTLNNILLEQGLVSEISLLVAPVLVGDAKANLFRSLRLGRKKPAFQLIKNRILEKNYLHLTYRIVAR